MSINKRLQDISDTNITFRYWWSRAFEWHLVRKNKEWQVEWTHLDVSYTAKMLLNFGYSHRLTVGPRTSLNSFIQQQFCLGKEVLWLHFTLDTLVPLYIRKHRRQTAVEVVQGLLDPIYYQKSHLILFFSLHIRKVAPKPGVWTRGGKCGFHM